MKRGREVGEMEAMDMANCLMLLSKVGQTVTVVDVDPISKHYSQGRVFACKTCNKRFSSFQALGGHRASHKKPRLTTGGDYLPDIPVSPKKPKTHECSICGLGFALGQALGGHMRRHRTASNEDGLLTQDLLPELKKKKSNGAESDLCLDLTLAPWGTDLDLKPVKVAPPTPVVHLFI